MSNRVRLGGVWGRLGGVCLLILVAGCTPLDDFMVSIFGRSMRDQPSFDPYEAPLGAPEGSIPFASGNFPAAPGEVNVGQPEALASPPPPFTQVDVLDESPVVMNLANPVPPTEESLNRGEELFLRFCAPCHGPNGAGVTGYIVPAGYAPIPLLTDKLRNLPDGYIYGMIRVGGRGLMPSYGHRISHFDRWNVVNYVRVLQGVSPASDGGAAVPSQGASPSGEGGAASGQGARPSMRESQGSGQEVPISGRDHQTPAESEDGHALIGGSSPGRY